MKNTLILLFLMASLVGCNAQTNKVFKKVDVATFNEGLSNKEVQLIDVRTPKEYDAGHIENAVLINFYSKDFKAKIQELDKDKPVYVYCKIGYRSGKAAIMLRDLGFTEVIDLPSGYVGWSKQ